MNPLGVIRMNGEKNAAAFDATLVACRQVLGSAHSDESSSQAADCSADTHAAEHGHDRTCGHKRPQTWNGQRADANKPPKRSADDRAGGSPGRCALGRLCT